MSYGVEIYNASGNVVLTITDRTARFAQSGSVTVAANSSQTVPVSGMQNNDAWTVIATNTAGVESSYNYSVDKNSGSFTLYNNFPAGTDPIDYQYIVVRS